MSPRYHVTGPLIEAAIVPTDAKDFARLLEALTEASARDPMFRFSADELSRQTIVGGASEDHLDNTIATLRRTSGIAFEIGAPQISYREYLRSSFDIDHTLARQHGSAGEFALVRLTGEPTPPDQSFHVENEAGPSLLAEHVAAVRDRLESARRNGVAEGFPVIGCRITLIEGAYHEIDSTPATFTAATSALLRQLKDDRVFGLLEPVMHVEATTPDEFMGTVLGDLNARRGLIGDMTSHEQDVTVAALVPLSLLFGYGNVLRSHTKGEGRFTMRYSHHEPVPPSYPDDRFRPAAAMRA